MADFLQPSPNPILRKRKSDNDMSDEVVEKRKTAAGAVLQSKENWVHKPIRQRSRYYCCRCITEQGLDGRSCVVCEHEIMACSGCLAGRISKSDSTLDSINQGTKDDVARYGQALRTFYQNQFHTQQEHTYQKLGSDTTDFNPGQHLLFNLPSHTWNLADIELEGDYATTPFAFSGNFPLFSVEAIDKMRRELLSNKVLREFQKSSDIVGRQLRGMVPDYARFTYNSWNHPKTLAAISEVVGLDLVPVMNIEISRVNILPSGHNANHPVRWHRDGYPYACVLMLSETTHMNGGEALFRTGSGAVVINNPPKKGFAYILQGRHIEQAVRSFEGCPERITAVTSFRPRSPFIEDQTRLNNVRGASDRAQLYSQFIQYRWRIAIERLAALTQVLNGEFISEWTPRPLSLGKNLEDIQHFLRDTSSQIGLPILGYAVPASSKVNAINVAESFSDQMISSYSVGLCQASDSLSIGGEIAVARGFDRDLVQSTFRFADNALLQLMRDEEG